MGPPSLKALEKALKDVTRLGIDSAPVIYFIDQNPRYVALVDELFQRVASGSLTAVTSTITITEVLIHPLRQGHHELRDSYLELLLGADNLSTLAVDAGMAAMAADMRARYTMRTPDALQIACAIAAQCDAFLTNDKRLKAVTEIPILVLDELLDREGGSG